MQVFGAVEEFPEAHKGAVIAIGNFDGVHRGHQSVLGRTMEIARAHRAPAGVMLFDPHPREFFAPDRPLFTLTPLDEKLALFEALGLDLAVALTFDRALASLSAEEFVARILVAGLGVRHVVIGYDFFFGKGREGNPDVMRALGERHGFGVTVVAPEGDAEEAFSSSRVRALLRQGRVREAAEQLGHWWRVKGRVVPGAGRGQGLGYPTANLALEKSQELAHGIYAVRVLIDGALYDGAAYLGTRPTFEEGPAVLEVFLFDFEGDLYGREVALDFIARIRGDQSFESAEALKAQMAADCDEARRILAEIAQDDPMLRFPLGRRLAGESTNVGTTK